MKNAFTTLFFIVLISCAQPPKQVETPAAVQTAPEKSCEKSVNYGHANICLPTISGMNECYEHPLVKVKANSFEYEGNTILAFYLDDATYKQVDKINEITFNEFFKIYATNITKDQEFGQSELDEYTKLFEGNYLKENWSEVQSKVNAKHAELKVGVPVLIESINENDNVRTFIMITRYQIDNTYTDVVMAANALLIDKTIIWLAYYNQYKNDKSIAALKEKNKKIIYELLKANGL